MMIQIFSPDGDYSLHYEYEPSKGVTFYLKNIQKPFFVEKKLITELLNFYKGKFVHISIPLENYNMKNQTSIEEWVLTNTPFIPIYSEWIMSFLTEEKLVVKINSNEYFFKE